MVLDRLLGPRTAGGIPEPFLVEERELLLVRLRLGAAMTVMFNALFVPLDLIRFEPSGFLSASLIRAAGCTLLVALGVATRARLARRWSLRLAAFGVFVIAAIILSIGRLPNDSPETLYLVQVMAVIFLVVGAAALLPLEGRTMLAIGSIPFALQVLSGLDFDPLENLPVVGSTLVALAIATVGAEVGFRYRLGDFLGRQAREELVRARSDFIDMLAHDLKNPIGVIAGYVEILRDRQECRAEERDLLDRIEAAARRALLLATNFLDVEKIQAKGMVVHRRPTDASRLLQRAIGNQRCIADAKGVRLIAAAEARPVPVEIDEPLLDRAMANLVNNAIKFTPSGGAVRISAVRTDGEVEIAVEDTGPGIPPELLERLFIRYGKECSSDQSTGLGLFIAKTIVDAHGGRIIAESRTDRPGARFRIFLPAGEASGSVPRQSPPAERSIRSAA